MSRTVDTEDPAERRERIRRLKEAVAAGNHNPDLDALAESLVDRLSLRRKARS